MLKFSDDVFAFKTHRLKQSLVEAISSSFSSCLRPISTTQYAMLAVYPYHHKGY
ncbi:hypothetical protein [Proteus faecis]|uniref:Uncharacterized protein n=2 Tax=Proteus faecis TaxID=2050967 RepID=A0ABZ3EPV4_9GAMM